MSDERIIQIEGPGVQPFWTAYTTAPEVQPSPSELDGMVVQNGAGADDGYAELIARANMVDPNPVIGFYTALRVTGGAVPLVSLNHAFDWFSCFNVRFGLSFASAASYAQLNVVASENADASVLVQIAPAASSVTFNNVVTDITNLVLNTLARQANGVTMLNMDLVEFHIVAKRLVRPSIGARAPFDIRLAFYANGTVYEVYRVVKTMKTTELFQSSFLCHVG